MKFQVDTIYCFYYNFDHRDTIQVTQFLFPYLQLLDNYQWNWNLRVSYASVKINDELHSFDLLKCPLIWFDIYSYRKKYAALADQNVNLSKPPRGYYSLGDHNSYGEMCME